MMTDWHLITAYTPEYRDEALALLDTVDAFEIRLHEYPYHSFGDWVRNCQETVAITLRALERFAPEPVIWIDADARMMQYPALFDDLAAGNCDIAVHRRMNKDGQGSHYNSGTIFWQNTDKVRAFINDQMDRLRDYNQMRAGHYPYMDYMLRQTEHDLNIYELPLEYSYIEGTEQPEEQIPFGRVVILHTQASRRMKKKIREANRDGGG